MASDSDSQLPPPRPRRRGRLRRALWWGLGAVLSVFVLLPALLVAGLILLADSQVGRTWIAAQIEAATAGSDTAVTIGAIGPGLPARLDLRQVRIADDAGTWLSVEALRLDWNPWALLRRTVRVDSLTGHGIALERLPEGEERAPEPGAPFDPRRLLPDLPVAISVGEVAVQEIAIAQPVAGVAARLDIHARAALTPDADATLVLDIRRTDGVEGRLQAQAEILRDPGGDRIDLDLDLREPPGGLIAALAGWPETEPVELRVTGQGPLQALDGRLTAAVGGIAGMEGSYRASYGGEGEALALTADLGGDIAALVPEPARALAAGPLALHLDLKAGAEDLRVEKLSLSGAALALAASAALDLNAGDMRAHLLLDRLDDAALQTFAPGLRLDQPILEMDLQGSMDKPDLALAFKADSLGMAGSVLETLDLTASLRPAGDLAGAALPPIDLVVDLTSARVRMAELAEAQDLLRDGLSLHVTGQADPERESFRLEDARLVLEALVLQAQGQMATSGPVRLQARLEAPDLAAPAALFGLPARGALMADLEAEGQDVLADEPGGWRVALAATLSDPGFGKLPLEELLGPQVTLESRATGRGMQAAELEHLALQGAGLELRGQGHADLVQGSMEAGLDLDLPVLAALSGLAGLDLSGSGSASLQVSGPIEAPALDARVALADAGIAGTPIQQAVLRAQVPRLSEPVSAAVELDGRAMDLPLRLRTDLALAAGGDRLALDGLRADLAGLLLDGRVDLDLTAGQASGGLRIAAPDLARTTAPLGLAAAGSLEGRLDMTPRSAGQGLVLDLTQSGLREEESGMAAEAVEIAADLVLADAGPRGTARLAVRQAVLGAARLDGVALQAEGDLGSGMQLDLAADGEALLADTTMPLSLAAQAVLRGLPPDLRAELSGLRLDLADVSLVQSGTATATVADAGGSIRDLLLLTAGGSLSVAASAGSDAIDLDLEATDLPLSLAALVLEDLPVTGTAGMTAELRLRPGRSAGQVALTLADLRATREDLQDFPPSQLSARAELGADSLRLTAEWQVPATEPGHLSMTIPMRLPPGALLPEPYGQGSLSGVVDWSGRLDKLALFLPGADSELAGGFEADLRIGGTLDDPLASGRVAIIDGSYGNYTTGTIVRDIQAQVEGNADSRLTISGSANDGSGGQLSIDGHLDLDADPLPEFHVTLRTQRFTMVRLDLATGTVSADLKASGTPQRNRIEGEIRVDSLAIEVSGGLPPSATVIPVTIYPRPGAAPLNPPTQRNNDRQTWSALDVTITIPPQMTVSGRGLESTWSGDLKVGGGVSNPLVTGQIRAVRGNFSMVGKRFVLSEGLIAFDGSRPPNPNLTIIFTYTGREAVANVEVRGTASEPRVNLTSTPPMPESDIISAVLFDRRSAELSAAEALEVATSLAALTGGGDPGAGITAEVRQALGLDVLSFGSNQDGQPTLDAGRYITEGVYVGVRQGLTAGSSSVAVQVDLTDNIQLETDVGTEATSSVGINWKLDY